MWHSPFHLPRHLYSRNIAVLRPSAVLRGVRRSCLLHFSVLQGKPPIAHKGQWVTVFVSGTISQLPILNFSIYSTRGFYHVTIEKVPFETGVTRVMFRTSHFECTHLTFLSNIWLRKCYISLTSPCTGTTILIMHNTKIYQLFCSYQGY